MGVTSQTLTSYHKHKGMPIFQRTVRGKPNIYDTEDVMMWWVNKEIDKRFGGLGATEDVVDREHEQGRLARASADGKELDNEVRRGELAPVSMMSDILGKVGSQIAAILDSIPQQVKRRVPSLSANDIEIIKKEVIKSQNAAASLEVSLEEYIDN